MLNSRLAGHGLRNEGRIYDLGGHQVKEGAARCSCGQTSPVLPNQAARQKWHKDHKSDVRAAMATKEER